jgi:hypothetical protein
LDPKNSKMEPSANRGRDPPFLHGPKTTGADQITGSADRRHINSNRLLRLLEAKGYGTNIAVHLCTWEKCPYINTKYSRRFMQLSQYFYNIWNYATLCLNAYLPSGSSIVSCPCIFRALQLRHFLICLIPQ